MTKHVQDTIAEAAEIAVTISVAFQDLTAIPIKIASNRIRETIQQCHSQKQLQEPRFLYTFDLMAAQIIQDHHISGV